MALARKGTRKIVVDGAAYRWTIAPADGPRIGIVAEAYGDGASRLVSWVELGVSISPGLVRRAILDGLAAGWKPERPGRDFVRRVPAFSEKRDAIHQCPACDHFTLPKRGQYDICPVCFWEDDGHDLDELDDVSGPNHLTLRDARKNFRHFGTCCGDTRSHVVDKAERGRYRYLPREA